METGRGEEEIKEFVKKRYARAANGSSCCEPLTCCGPLSRAFFVKMIGYSSEELEDLPESVINTVSGCGNPTALADLREGETVLDLGSGGGIDVLLAAKKVGPRGKVIGVDMTQEMIKLANENAKNVEFRLGEIESLPIENESVDVVISNCVINLSPDKDKVFREAFRVLKPGRRMLISDIVTQGELPKKMRGSLELWAGCIAGALDEQEYLRKIRDAGFRDVEVLSRGAFLGKVYSIKVRAYKPSHNPYGSETFLTASAARLRHLRAHS